MMEAIYKSILSMFTATPLWVVGLLSGLMLSWLVVQGVKFLFPIEWPPENRRQGAQFIAFATGFMTAVYVMGWPTGAMVGLFAGFGSPVVYAYLMKFLNWKYPAFADVLSGDIRGTLIGEKKENKP